MYIVSYVNKIYEPHYKFMYTSDMTCYTWHNGTLNLVFMYSGLRFHVLYITKYFNNVADYINNMTI